MKLFLLHIKIFNFHETIFTSHIDRHFSILHTIINNIDVIYNQNGFLMEWLEFCDYAKRKVGHAVEPCKFLNTTSKSNLQGLNGVDTKPHVHT